MLDPRGHRAPKDQSFRPVLSWPHSRWKERLSVSTEADPSTGLAADPGPRYPGGKPIEEPVLPDLAPKPEGEVCSVFHF